MTSETKAAEPRRYPVKPRFRRRFLAVVGAGLAALVNTGCATLEAWFESGSGEAGASGGAAAARATDEGDLISVLPSRPEVPLHPEVLAQQSLPPAEPVAVWHQENRVPQALSGHMRTSALEAVVARAKIGEGHGWREAALASSPVVTRALVMAMDGRGYISAHKRGDPAQRRWSSGALASEQALLTGGLAFVEDRLLALTSEGTIAALDARSGDVLWRFDVGSPLRSSLRVAGEAVLAVTADSRVIALSWRRGKLLWEHRSVGAEEGLFGTTTPAATEEAVFAHYTQGELVRLDAATGKPAWSDSVVRRAQTSATRLFEGVDASPVVREDVVYAASTTGMMAAYDARSGERYWALPVGTRHSPAIAGALLFAVTEHGKLVAVEIFRGLAGWRQPLAAEQATRSASRRYYGPFLISGTLVVVDATGAVYRYDAMTGTPEGRSVLCDSVAGSPAFAGARAYLVGRDATLYVAR